MARRKYTVTPELRQEICDLYEQRNGKGKRIWTHKSLAKRCGLPKKYITAYLNGFVSLSEYQNHRAQKAGFASYTEYQKHLAQKAGFASRTEYQNHRAQKAGFASRTEYQNHRAQKAGFASYTEYQKHLAQERGELEVFLLKRRLGAQLWNTLNQYTKHGKVQSSFEYGVDYSAIIASLELEAEHVHGKSIAELRSLGYHVDHIIPVSAYDLEDADEVARAYSPQNLRWLPGAENESKNAKLILDLILQVPPECHPKKWTTLGIDWHAVNAYVDVTLCAGVSSPFFDYTVSEQVQILINTQEDVIHFGGPEVHIVFDGEILSDDIEEVYDEEFFSHDSEEVAS